VNTDNARRHTAKVTFDFMERNAMKRAPHPPYSPDLAPSGFYLFGHVQQFLRGDECADREACLHPMEDILRGMTKVMSEDVFVGWRERISQYGSAAGEYVEQIKFLHESHFSLLILS
jgi:histone-lysine N-methyltransferase SETMAR